MSEKKSQVILLITLILVLFVLNYPFIDSALKNFLSEKKTVFVERVVDGDTIKYENESVRLLGINTPERGEFLYSEAKEFLESKILNKTVMLEFGSPKKDKYKRELAYVFYRGKNINVEIVKSGLANPYFPAGREKYEREIRDAWKNCLASGKNLCEKSEDKCAECIALTKLDVNSQKVVFSNQCDFTCDLNDWEIQDEGRKRFYFEDFELERNKDVKIIVGEGNNTEEVLFWQGENYVWTKTGDTLFLRDGEGKIVLWEGYR